MYRILLLFLVCTPLQRAAAQADTLPYASIADHPADHSPGSVLGRMVDALGFRYYWASRDLREGDLDYRPSPTARSCRETLEHIHGLTTMILSAARGDTLGRGPSLPDLDYPQLRARTLRNLAEASSRFAGRTAEEIADSKLRFAAAGGQYTEYPVWNLINGPLADAIYHTGQVVTFRRATDNPSDPRVNHFLGQVAD